MKKNIIICVTAIILLSGCGLQKGGSIRQDHSDFGQNLRMMFSSKGLKADNNITNKDITSSEYAYIVGSFYGRNEWLHISKNFDDSWEDDEVVELPFRNQKFSLTYDENPTFNYDIYKVKLGRYTLVTFASAPKNDSFYRSVDPDREENDKIKQNDSIYASFEAKAGELTYVGDMSMMNGYSLDIRDNKTAVIQYLKENYTNLENPQQLIKTHLALKGKRFRESK
ncbi:MAG: hypothetical protein NC218_11910 [Acetobacter sp.]|nr:hypothetical protein [Acetobacter sp.]